MREHGNAPRSELWQSPVLLLNYSRLLPTPLTFLLPAVSRRLFRCFGYTFQQTLKNLKPAAHFIEFSGYLYLQNNTRYELQNVHVR